jgi:outer membrane protein assembly factor BamB
MSIILDIRSEGQTLKLFAQNQVGRTVTHFEEKKADPAEISSLCQQIMGKLDKAIHTGGLGKGGLEHFQKLGLSLYELLFTQHIKDKLQQAKDQHLILRIDESLVNVPWELLYDGEEFFSLNLSLGRKVYTRLEGIEHHRSEITFPLKVLVVANPRDDLNSAHQEGVSVMEMLKQLGDRVAVDFKSTSVTPQMLKLCIRDYDIVHYAGHAEYNQTTPLQSGWLMKGGIFSAEDIMAMSNVNKPMPALIFSNACQSGKSVWKIDESSNQQIFGLANAFLLSGVTHYIGTCRDILDKHSGHFALTFYQNLLNGDSIGKAMQKARLEMLNKFGKSSVLWASYLLYGDPSTKYKKKTAQTSAAEQLPKSEAERAKPKSLSRWMVLGVLGIFIIIAVKFLSPKPVKVSKQPEKKATIQPVTPKIIPKKPALIISSVPTGASVVLNKEVWGTTPLKRQPPPGAYNLLIRKFGYHSVKKSVGLGDKDVGLNIKLSPDSNWLMFRHDPTHSAGRGEKLTHPLKLKWKFATGGRVRSAASLVEGTLFIGAEDNYLYALNAEDGKLIWKCRTGGHIYSTPAVVGNIVYASSTDGVLYAVDSKNKGSILWRENLSSSGRSSPAVSLEDGQLYVGTNDGKIYQLDLDKNSGRIKHSYTTRGNIASSPVIYKRNAYVGSGDGGLYCISSGQFRKVYQTSGGITAPPLIRNEQIYVGSEDEHLYALSVEGHLRWRCDQINGEIVTSPVLAKDKLFLGTAGGWFYSVSASDGHLVWDKKLGGPILTAPVISDNLIFIGCDDGYLYTLKIEDGAIIGRYHIGNKIRSSPILISGTIYLGADDHYVYALTGQ